MAVGAALGAGGLALPWVEIGIAGSVLVLGAAVALAWRPAVVVGAVWSRPFAVLHGYATGRSCRRGLSAGLRGGLHRRDARLARHRHRDRRCGAACRLLMRSAGGAIAVVGLALLVVH